MRRNGSEDEPVEETEDIPVDILEDASTKNEEESPPPPMTEEEEEIKDNLETMARIVQGALAGRRALDRDQDFLWVCVAFEPRNPRSKYELANSSTFLSSKESSSCWFSQMTFPTRTDEN